MRIVDRPYTRPNRCAVFPHIGQTNRNVRWIDTGSEMLASGHDQHVYLSDAAVYEAAKLLGMPLRGEHGRVKAELAAAVAELEQVVAERDELRRKLDAIDVIESEGFRARKKTGRPSKQQEVGV